MRYFWEEEEVEQKTRKYERQREKEVRFVVMVTEREEKRVKEMKK